MKWHARRDWAGWSFGWYPTHDDGGTLTLQKINWYCINLDIGETRIRFTYKRNPLEEAPRKHRRLPPTPRLLVERYSAPSPDPEWFKRAMRRAAAAD